MSDFPPPSAPEAFNILVIGQAGRVGYEALLLAASLAENAPKLVPRLFVAEPQPGALWDEDPRMGDSVRGALKDLGAQVVPFESRVFGASYPHGNKIEGLSALPAGEPFLFLDSDTLITGDLSAVPFDFNRPSASMRRTGTWPEEELYWPGYTAIWKSLYDKFGLDFESSLDLSHPDEYWERYLYFNAGWFFGADATAFGARFTEYAQAIRDETPEELVIQSLDPWLDQIALPLVIHSFGGGRPGPELNGLDGDVTSHWRMLPMVYARSSDRLIEVLEHVAAPNKIKKVLKEHEPFKRFIYQGRSQKVCDLIAKEGLPEPEKKLRNFLKKKGFWMR